MNKEEILSKNRADNLFLDEYDKQKKCKGQSFGLLLMLLLCVMMLALKTFAHQDTSDIVTIVWGVLFSVMAYRAYTEKDKASLVIAGFSFVFMVYDFIKFLKFLMVV